MEELKVFFFEDDESFYSFFYRMFEVCWNKKYPENKLIHDKSKDYFSNARSTLEMILLPDFDYHICFVDMLAPSPFSDENVSGDMRLVNIGKDIINSINEKERKCVISAISIGDTIDHPKMESSIRESGIDFFFYKSEMKNRDALLEPIERICNLIHQRCVDKGIIKDKIEFEYNKDDPKLQYIISEIGKKNIKSLYQNTLPKNTNITKIVANYLAPGLSGAFVLQMDAYFKGSAKATHLLKINRDKNILKREIENRPLLGRYSPKLFINYLQTSDTLLPESNNWYAISSAFESGTITLRDWLRQLHANSHIENVFNKIFFDYGMALGYKEAILTEGLNPLEVNLTPSRIARILIAIDELEEICKIPTLGGDLEWENKAKRLRDFLNKKYNIDLNTMQKEIFTCDCHGDFHTRNILVSDSNNHIPTIIDTAEFGRFHWSTDFVRLIVDLIVTCYDYGIESHKWIKIKDWLSITDSIIKLKPIDSTDSVNKGIISALNWMIKSFYKLFPFLNFDNKKHQKEFSLSIGIEFLRSSYRTDITIQKRVLALQSAFLAIEYFETNFIQS